MTTTGGGKFGTGAAGGEDGGSGPDGAFGVVGCSGCGLGDVGGSGLDDSGCLGIGAVSDVVHGLSGWSAGTGVTTGATATVVHGSFAGSSSQSSSSFPDAGFLPSLSYVRSFLHALGDSGVAGSSSSQSSLLPSLVDSFPVRFSLHDPVSWDILCLSFVDNVRLRSSGEYVLPRISSRNLKAW